MNATKVHEWTWWEGLQLWWIADGELYNALAQYYVLCVIAGWITGCEIGRMLAGL